MAKTTNTTITLQQARAMTGTQRLTVAYRIVEKELEARFKEYFRVGMGLFAPKLDGWLQSCGQFSASVVVMGGMSWRDKPKIIVRLMESGKRAPKSMYWDSVEYGHAMPPAFRVWAQFPGRTGAYSKQPAGLRLLRWKMGADMNYYWFYDYRRVTGSWENARVHAVSKPLGTTANVDEAIDDPYKLGADRVFTSRKAVKVRPRHYIRAAFSYAMQQLQRELWGNGRFAQIMRNMFGDAMVAAVRMPNGYPYGYGERYFVNDLRDAIGRARERMYNQALGSGHRMNLRELDERLVETQLPGTWDRLYMYNKATPRRGKWFSPVSRGLYPGR